MIARAFRQLLVLLAAALVPAVVAGVIQLKQVKPDPVPQIEAAAARALGDGVLWVDARPRKEFDAGHIEGAVLLNEDEWNSLIPHFLNEWDPDKPIVVYCGGGGCQASKAVANRLITELQMENVRILKGGLKAWRAE
jgi:rhodanese-related sulfurtransferase